MRLDQLQTTLDVLHARGFRHAYAWEESLPLNRPGELAGLDSAFVMGDEADGEVDIHIYDRDRGYELPEAHRQDVELLQHLIKERADQVPL